MRGGWGESYLFQMFTFIKMVITGVENGSPGEGGVRCGWRESYLSQMFTFSKMVITGLENRSPDIIPVPFDAKFHR